jgi:murein DD-endopeptidase MepM/ murein hydrolase activator NlpD
MEWKLASFEDQIVPEKPKIKPWKWALVLCFVAALFSGFWFLRSRGSVLGPMLLPDMQTWTDAKAKQAAADALNKTVKSPGFKVEVHKVDEGENFWGVAKDYKVNIDTVVGFNPELEDLDASLGQPLLLPNQRGCLHQVAAGEGADTLAAMYQVPALAITAANSVPWSELSAGQVLFIPGGHPRQLSPAMRQLFQQRRLFRSPLQGVYTSLVGERIDPFTGEKKLHNGVDIRAAFNSLVCAAAGGKIVLAGWNGGFGKCVIISHGNGYKTLYGHLNAILVHSGQRVRQGQAIARVGVTGRTTGPHLHFTVYLNNRVKDPLKYLW